MINKGMADNYLNQAKDCLKEASMAIDDKKWYRTVRRSQEVLELAIKALFRLFTIEFPKEHDVPPVIDEIIDKIPQDKREILRKAKEIMPLLAKDREPAMYGDEDRGIPPDALFKEEYARKMFNEVKEIVNACDSIIKISKG